MHAGRDRKGQFAPGHKLSKGPRKRGKAIPCQVCGKEFYCAPARLKTAKYCSYKCAGLGMRNNEPRKCRNCGKKYYRPQSQVRWRGSSCCSNKCKFEYAKETGRNRGKMSGQWKGGKIKTAALDVKFSRFIRYRDGYQCQRCKKIYLPPTRALHNSHFIGRKNQAVRYDPENCDAACYGCHRFWEANRVTDYRDWKIAQLGRERYDLLIERSRKIAKRTTAEKKELAEQIAAWLYETKDKYESDLEPA